MEKRADMLLSVSDHLCDLVDDLMRHYDPCQLKDNSCRVVDDIENSVPVKHCCRNRAERCEFLRGSKCTVRNINCKLWFCVTALEAAGPEFYKAVKTLEDFARVYNLVSPPFLGQKYIGMTAEIEAMRIKESQ